MWVARLCSAQGRARCACSCCEVGLSELVIDQRGYASQRPATHNTALGFHAVEFKILRRLLVSAYTTLRCCKCLRHRFDVSERSNRSRSDSRIGDVAIRAQQHCTLSIKHQDGCRGSSTSGRPCAGPGVSWPARAGLLLLLLAGASPFAALHATTGRRRTWPLMMFRRLKHWQSWG